MKLYNTLSRQVEEIKPIDPKATTIYTCGPTVYDYPHIGNWFTFIRYDLLVRALRVSGKNPKWVMNITDVGHLVSDADEGEDKLEKGARRENKTAWDIAKFYGDYFIEALDRLNISKPDHLPKATDHIKEQVELIQKLESKGYTYTIDDGVYFDTSKFEGYSDFAQLDIDDLLAGARVEVNPQKRNNTDFALWKFSPKDHQRDMEWDSPWGKGFPGWHIECSAMSMKYLGETLDIHSGGIDHVPVHHTNEIAQSEAATGKRFAEYWMHTNHILINDEKISKSLGNSILLEDIEKQGFSLEDLRFLVLQSHYRTQSKFSWDTMSGARAALRNIRNNFSWVYRTDTLSDTEHESLEEILGKAKQNILEVLLEDLDTPQAVALLHEQSDAFATYPASKHDVKALEAFATFVQDALGIQILDRSEITQDQKDLIAKREDARKAKEWAISDKLRDELKAQGIGLNDRLDGVIWYRL